jgi:hypothetical protein
MMTAARPIHRTCKDCGSTFEISADEQQRFRALQRSEPTRKWELPARCYRCRRERREARTDPIGDVLPDTSYTLTCIECQGSFVMDAGEIAFFKARGYSWPNRCRSCRAHRYASA